jgi:hypothetical protein
MIIVYAISLRLSGSEALAEADKRIGELAEELDPDTALVQRGLPTEEKPDWRSAGLLHNGESPVGDLARRAIPRRTETVKSRYT